MRFNQDYHDRLIHEAKMCMSVKLEELTPESLRSLLEKGHNVAPFDCKYYIVPPYKGGPYEIYRYVGPDCMRGNDVVCRTHDVELAVMAFLRYVDPTVMVWGVF